MERDDDSKKSHRALVDCAFSRRRTSPRETAAAARPCLDCRCAGCRWRRAMLGPKNPPRAAQWPYSRRPATDRNQLHSSRSPALVERTVAKLLCSQIERIDRILTIRRWRQYWLLNG